MKKLFLALCVTVCLLFSVATPVRADEGNGHDPGYVCIETETAACPPDSAALPQQQSETSGSNGEKSEEDTSLTLLELVITLILNS